MKKIRILNADPSIKRLLAEELTAEGNVTIDIGKIEYVSEKMGNHPPGRD